MILLSSLLSFDLNAQATTEGDAVLRPSFKHVDRTAHPDLRPFAKERNRADDPVEFESPEAEGLWRAVVLHLQQNESGYYASGLKTGGEFAVLAGECFLVVYDTVFYACPNRNVFEQLTPSEVSGIQTGDLLSLPHERSWMLVEASGLHHGIYYSSFTAIVLSTGKDGIGVAKAFPLASAAQNSDDPGSDTPCGEEQDRKNNGFDDQNPGRVISHDLIKDASGYVTRISFTLLRQNCKSMKRTRVVEDYVYSENGFSKSESSVPLGNYEADVPIGKKAVVPNVVPSRDDESCSGSSGNVITLCAITTEERNAKVRQKRFQKIVRAYGSADKLEVNHLQAATERFASNRGRFESDATGTARGAIAIEARVEELNLLLNDMERFELGNFPEVRTAAELATTDQELNQVYKKILGMRSDKDNRFGLSDITLDGIRATERSWIAYRDAWVQFAHLRYRHFDPISLQYFLAKRRLAELEDMFETIRTCVLCPSATTTE